MLQWLASRKGIYSEKLLTKKGWVGSEVNYSVKRGRGNPPSCWNIVYHCRFILVGLLHMGTLRDWSKSIGGWAGAERGWVISFWTLGKGWVVQFLATRRGWVILFLLWELTHIWHNHKKGNSFRTIKARDTLKHQPTVWHTHSQITQAGAQWAPDPGSDSCFCLIRPHRHIHVA